MTVITEIGRVDEKDQRKRGFLGWRGGFILLRWWHRLFFFPGVGFLVTQQSLNDADCA